MPGFRQLKTIADRIWKKIVTGVPILLYHRILEMPSDPQLLCVRPNHFAAHLEALRRKFHPMSLRQLVQALDSHHVPKGAVVITLDDGYADNLYEAKPILEYFEFPTTVFVATGYMGNEREFWWDELEKILLQPGRLPERLQLTINGRTITYELGNAADYRENTYRSNLAWNVTMSVDPSDRHRIYRSLCQLLRPLPEGKRREALDELLLWAGMEPKVRPNHHALSADELLHLAEGGLIEIGSHTETHPVLSSQPAAGQKTEIHRSKVLLENLLGHSVTSFAYPYGSRSDYTEETLAIVREAGYSCACSSSSNVVWRGSDRYQLPRILVQDWNGEDFSKRLEAVGVL